VSEELTLRADSKAWRYRELLPQLRGLVDRDAALAVDLRL
jgi:hypothetical protein